MIGLFNDCFPPIMDGVSVTVSNYAYWLQRKRGDVCVVTPQAPKADDREDYPVYRYLSMPIPMRKPYRLGFPRIDWPFHRQLSKIPFELVHAHCPFSSGVLAHSVAKSKHIPLVATFHSKYRTDFERVIPTKFMVDRLIQNIVEFYEQADEVWIPQAAVEPTLREYGYKGKVEVVDNGNDFAGTPYTISLKEQAKGQLGVSGDTPLLLFVGQHIWEKNTAFLLRALAKVHDAGMRFRAMFVGTGYAAEEMKQMAQDLGLSKGKDDADTGGCVSFHGMVSDRDKLKRYFLAADLFLFPSLYDNAPLVVREAAALHTPALLLRGSTAADIVKDGYNGFLSDNDEEAYARLLANVVGNSPLIESVGARAAETLARSWEDIADEVDRRYTALVQRYNLEHHKEHIAY